MASTHEFRKEELLQSGKLVIEKVRRIVLSRADKLCEEETLDKKKRAMYADETHKIADEVVIETLEEQGISALVFDHNREISVGREKPEAIFLVNALDGSLSFGHQIPYYAASIAIAPKREDSVLKDVEVGFVENLVTGDLYVGIRREGAYLNGRRIKTSEERTIENSIVVVNLQKESYDRLRNIFLKTGLVTFAGAASLALCSVAHGGTDAAISLSNDVVHISAGKLIVEEAGGRFTDAKGRALDWWKLRCSALSQRTSIVASGNEILHKRLLGYLK